MSTKTHLGKNGKFSKTFLANLHNFKMAACLWFWNYDKLQQKVYIHNRLLSYPDQDGVNIQKSA